MIQESAMAAFLFVEDVSMADRTLTEHDIRSENVIHPVGMFGS